MVIETCFRPFRSISFKEISFRHINFWRDPFKRQNFVPDDAKLKNGPTLPRSSAKGLHVAAYCKFLVQAAHVFQGGVVLHLTGQKYARNVLSINLLLAMLKSWRYHVAFSPILVSFFPLEKWRMAKVTRIAKSLTTKIHPLLN